MRPGGDPARSAAGLLDNQSTLGIYYHAKGQDFAVELENVDIYRIFTPHYFKKNAFGSFLLVFLNFSYSYDE